MKTRKIDLKNQECFLKSHNFKIILFLIKLINIISHKIIINIPRIGVIMPRLYGDKENINSVKVKDFFNKKANNDVESEFAIVFFEDTKNSENGICTL